MSLTNYYYFSYSLKGAVVKKTYLLNKKIVHVINDIFWNMGFKTETQAEKVMHIIAIISIKPIIPIKIYYYFNCKLLYSSYQLY